MTADVVQQVARLSFPTENDGASPVHRLQFETATNAEVTPLLAAEHYLGPVTSGRYVFAGWVDNTLACCQVWRHPTSRMLPTDWLELSRWCLTPLAGPNAGSRMMRWVTTWLRHHSEVTTLVSYSELGRHSGALYKASGWVAASTHHTERWLLDRKGYPSAHGSWDGVTVQQPKQRWIYELGTDE